MVSIILVACNFTHALQVSTPWGLQHSQTSTTQQVFGPLYAMRSLMLVHMCIYQGRPSVAFQHAELP
jgi:hypothetical protein